MTTQITDRTTHMFEIHGSLAATILDAEATALRVGNRAAEALRVSSDFTEFTGGPGVWYRAGTSEEMVRSAYVPGCEDDPGADQAAVADGHYIAAAHPLVVRQLAATTAATARFVAGEIGIEALVDHLRCVTAAVEQSSSDIHRLKFYPRPDADEQ